MKINKRGIEIGMTALVGIVLVLIAAMVLLGVASGIKTGIGAMPSAPLSPLTIFWGEVLV